MPTKPSHDDAPAHPAAAPEPPQDPLDAALDGSFPASDPIPGPAAALPPAGAVRPPER